jgi:hypothetical protein
MFLTFSLIEPQRRIGQVGTARSFKSGSKPPCISSRNLRPADSVAVYTYSPVSSLRSAQYSLQNDPGTETFTSRILGVSLTFSPRLCIIPKATSTGAGISSTGARQPKRARVALQRCMISTRILYPEGQSEGLRLRGNTPEGRRNGALACNPGGLCGIDLVGSGIGYPGIM